MGCDRDMALVNQKVRAEILERWVEEFRSCCKKPSPFEIIKTEHIKPYYKASCPIQTCPIHKIIFSQDFPYMFQ